MKQEGLRKIRHQEITALHRSINKQARAVEYLITKYQITKLPNNTTRACFF